VKILVTGGAGFIGSHIADELISLGHEVVVIDNLETGNLNNLNPEAKFYLTDIRAKELEKIFAIEKFDVIYHQAAQMDVRRSVRDPLFDADVNVKGTLNLLQNAVRFGIKRFIFASTGGAIYGEQEVFPCDETHPTKPVSPYGITKLSVEKYLFFYAGEYDLTYTIFRYANVYGPRQNPHGEAGVVAIFAQKLLNREQPVINGDGLQTRDYVFVKDVVKANIAGLTAPANEIFNIGTGVETDVNTIFNLINQAAGSGAEEKHGSAKPGEQKRSVISYEKAKKVLGWEPSLTIKQGIEETVLYFKSNSK